MGSGKSILVEVVQAKLEQLRARSFDELSSLPSCLDDEMRVDHKKISIATWKDVLPDGNIRIVVQAYMIRFLGGLISANGFILRPDGAQLAIPKEMMFEFI